MLLTEDEAKTKTCPLTFAVQEIRKPEWNGVREPGPWNCIGSGCMAWRWTSSDEGEGLVEAIKRRRTETNDTLLAAKNYVETHPEYRRRPQPDHGFCGMAGSVVR